MISCCCTNHAVSCSGNMQIKQIKKIYRATFEKWFPAAAALTMRHVAQVRGRRPVFLLPQEAVPPHHPKKKNVCLRCRKKRTIPSSLQKNTLWLLLYMYTYIYIPKCIYIHILHMQTVFTHYMYNNAWMYIYVQYKYIYAQYIHICAMYMYIET